MKRPTLAVIVSCLVVLGVFVAMLAVMFGVPTPEPDLNASGGTPAKTTAQVTWLGGSTHCGLTRLEGEGRQTYLLDASCMKSRSGAYGSSITSLVVDGKRAYVIRRPSEYELVIRLSES